MGTRYTPIICIGLGLSGIALGAQLKRKYGLSFVDVHFYDRNEGHGGTWLSNQYPGAACDIPTYFYSFSFALNFQWTEFLAGHAEIRLYIDEVVKRFKLAPLMTFRTVCEFASWDNVRQRWIVHLMDLETGEKYVHECTVLFSAVGQLVEPKSLTIQGTDTFEGTIFHTARWRADVDLEGKHTIVIGNGCTGSQVVPKIVSQTKTLTQFIHTPHWLLPVPNRKFGKWSWWAFAVIPLLARLMRFSIFLYTENKWRMFVMDEEGAKLRRAAEERSKQYILRTAPKKFHNILIPDWEIGCKRRIFDSNKIYAKSLHAPNLDLVKDDIIEVLPRAVRTASKTFPADVIILATGFDVQKSLRLLRVQGRDGEWLHDHWSKMGGPAAYDTTAVHGFPNFFILFGPNSATGHTSVLMTTENTINYALKIIAPILKGMASAVEVKADAEKEYVAQVQAASKTVVISGCANFYSTENGWNSSMYPWSQVRHWWRSTFPIWRDWEYKRTSRHNSIRRTEIFKTALMVLGTSSLIGALVAGKYTRTL